MSVYVDTAETADLKELRRKKRRRPRKTHRHTVTPGGTPSPSMAQASGAVYPGEPLVGQAQTSEIRSLNANTPVSVKLKPKDEWKRIQQDIMATKGRAKVLMALNKEDAQHTVDIIAKCNRGIEPLLRKRAMWLMSYLCKKHCILPASSIILQKITLLNKDHPLRGGCAIVYEGRLNSGKKVAVKTPLAYNQAMMCKEASIWFGLRHPNVLRFMGVVMSDEISLITPWMSKGHIGAFLQKNPNMNRLKLLVDIAAGLTFLHQSGVVHGDLKSANILVDDSGNACLADFGLSRIATEGTTYRTFTSSGGTLAWMAPELLKGRQPSYEADVYAFAVVAWELFAGTVPYRGYHHEAISRNVSTDNLRPERPPKGEKLGLSDELWALLEKCWDADAESRPKMPDVVHFVGDACAAYKPGRLSPADYPSAYDERKEVSESLPSSLWPH